MEEKELVSKLLSLSLEKFGDLDSTKLEEAI